MWITKYCVKSLRFNHVSRYFSAEVKMNLASPENFSKFLADHFKVSDEKIEAFLNKNVQFYNYEKDHILDVMNVLRKYSFRNSLILKYPKLFSLSPVTIENRVNVLKECGFHDNIIPDHLPSYLSLISRKTIYDLKEKKIIPEDTSVQEQLVRCLSGWPTSQPMPEPCSDSSTSLYQTRMRILQRYLELNIDLPADEFQQKLITYPRIKHRPLKVIDTIINILQNHLKISNKKIRTNFGILQSNPSNIELILKKVRSLAGVDIKEIVQLKPSILNVNYKTLQKNQDILNDYGIPFSSQRRCFEVFLLSPDTIQTRISSIKDDPDLQAHFYNPRIMRLVYYKTKADARLSILHEKNKKCISINVLSGCSKHYESFAYSAGDQTKGLDTTRALCSLLEDTYSYKEVQSSLQKHKFFTQVPLQNIHRLFTCMKQHFNLDEIFNNCHLVLYPLERVEHYLLPLLRYRGGVEEVGEPTIQELSGSSFDGVELSRMSNYTILSLTLYLLERDYYFSGDGVWSNQSNTPVVVVK